MTEPLPNTDHFGFTRIGTGEGISKNGFAATDNDTVRIDDLIFALTNHTHTGEEALGDPSDPPTFVTVSTDGHLPPATTFFYRVAYLDRFGLETASSPEGSVTTPNPIAPPPSPSGTVEPSSGAVLPGVYSYLTTYYDPYGGESTPSSVNNVQVTQGTTNRIRLDFGDTRPDGVTGIRVYRSRPGQNQFYYVGSSTGTNFYDAGAAEDQTILAPSSNTTNSSNSIEVTVPLGFIPLGCVAWRLYRATESGDYDGECMVHEVVEGVTETSIIPRVMWVDTGDSLLPGQPLETTSTIGEGKLLTLDELSGTLPLSVVPRGSRILSFFAPGTLTDGEVLTVTESPTDVKPVRMTVYMKTPPASGESVTIRITGDSATPAHVDVVCGSAPAAGDPTGYYHAEWPLVESLRRYLSDAYTTVNDATTTGLITDPVSDTGQSMLLDQQNEWAQVDMGILDAGSYQILVNLRTNETTTTANDVRIDVIRTDTTTSIANVQPTVTNTVGFTTYGTTFTAPGGVDIGIRITKLTTAAQTYEVQDVQFFTVVPDLAAGMFTATALVAGGGSTVAADANVALWF